MRRIRLATRRRIVAESTGQDEQDPQAVSAAEETTTSSEEQAVVPADVQADGDVALVDVDVTVEVLDAEVGSAAGEEAAVAEVDSTGGDDPLAQIVASLEEDEAAEEFTRSSAELKAIVEALIFASPDPLTPKALLKLVDNEPKEDVLAALEELKRDYERPGGLQIVEVAGGYQIVTRPDLNEWVRRLFHERSTQKLSVQALESLAVIAYRQPITAIEITEIRGVNTSGVLNTLLERHLIKIVGRKQVVGRPFMYATTKEFLIRFGLKDLNDLPKMEDMADVLGFEPPSGLTDAGPSETLLPLDGEVDPDRTLETEKPQ
jgi:segregation and condensation protein B